MSSERATVVIEKAERTPEAHPCEIGIHRWAWLTSGGQACGYCGVSRR